MDIPMYPKLVREFYENMRRTEDDLDTTIKRVHFEISESILAGIFDLPREGIVPERISNKKTRLRLIVGREDIVGEFLASTLLVEMRILHHIIGGIFIPKLGRWNFISERELAVIYHIVKGIPLNLPDIMMHQMREASARNKVCLPYGMALTRLFEAAKIK